MLLYLGFRPINPVERSGWWKHPWLATLIGGAALFLVVFAPQIYFEMWPKDTSLKIIFATPGLILATAFITFPFVARELIPVMEAVGVEEELAAVSLGANGWQVFWQITVPNIKWGLIYGIILCNARAMGEFGAVYVVSGHIAGLTDTMPLRIEKLFQEYNLPGSFAVASLLTLVALADAAGEDRRRPGGSRAHQICGRRNQRVTFMSISIDRVSKKFGNFTALEHVSLDVPDGELLALLGPSGSGKTTLLRIIAGLEVADSGTVISDGEDITDQSARHRKVGFVFQHYALFRHMTVAQNIAYGLKVRKAPKKLIRERVDEMLHLIRLETLQNRYPAQLSGGQRQRVALARALASQPSVLLLDEPFGALDAKVRQELRQWIRRLHDEIHVTSIFVTHDQEEAFEVADRVVVMNHARIEQIGTPQEVYNHPATAFVYQFLGNVTTFRGTVRDEWFQLGETSVYLPVRDEVRNGPAIACVRHHDVKVHLEPSDVAPIAARITHVNAAGSIVRVELERLDDKSRIAAELAKENGVPPLHPGSPAFVELRNVRVFADDDPHAPASNLQPAAAV